MIRCGLPFSLGSLMAKYTIQKHIPVPTVRVSKTERPRARKYPLDTMEVGDMFFVPHKTKNELTTYISAAGRQLDRKFTTRLVYMAPGRKAGTWVIAEDTTPQAVLGVGVWRTQ